jgi:D-alanyl-D-alanine carboxypeptidase/D-alanyl-D-alanine-endopeptidase (penicillin-binding protein 4)
VAGQTGTLARRFLGTAVAGHLAAKTGTIIGAGAMVGRLDVSGSVRFALVANGPFPVAAGVGLEDRVVGVLSGYRRP